MLMKIGYVKKSFSQIGTIWDKNGGTCVHRRTMDVMLRVLSNRLMSKLTDTSAYLGV